MNVIVLISADVEWQSILLLHPDVEIQKSPLGEWFEDNIVVVGNHEKIRFFHGGWGKIAAAASTQYVIDRWKPDLLINLGTCGGFEGAIEKGDIVLVERTIVYDIVEQMGDNDSAVDFYSTEIDLSWLSIDIPSKCVKTLMVSGDRDLMVGDLQSLKQRYHARVGDWESGAIAFVASRNQTRLLIIRGVTDLVGEAGNETYGNFELFKIATQTIMQGLDHSISGWLEAAGML
jgi:adenosylhomocysteine nucleosidase